jgi:hypothetical protein
MYACMGMRKRRKDGGKGLEQISPFFSKIPGDSKVIYYTLCGPGLLSKPPFILLVFKVLTCVKISVKITVLLVVHTHIQR